MQRRRPRTKLCERCRSKMKVGSRGRVPRFCSSSCRQLEYEQRKWQRPTPVQLLAQDINTALVREVIRREFWAVLKEAGLVSNLPAPVPPKPRRRGHLRLVTD